MAMTMTMAPGDVCVCVWGERVRYILSYGIPSQKTLISSSLFASTIY